MTAIVQHDFYGQQVTLLERDGESFVLLDQLCSHMSVDREPQRKNLARQVWAKGMTVIMEVILPGEFRAYPRTAINVKIIGMWLANITTSRIKDDHARQMVERYQIELTQKVHEWLSGPSAPRPELPQNYLEALKHLVISEENRQKAELRAITEGARADRAQSKVDAYENSHGLKVTRFVQLYFPDYTRNQLFAFFYDGKKWLVNNPRAWWSEKSKKWMPGADHQQPKNGGGRYFYMPEELDKNGRTRFSLRVRRDTQHELVQVLEQHGFRPVLASTFDAELAVL